MNEDKQKEIAEKIKKLLALSQSQNEHEAAVAMQKVEEILTRYNMSLTDVEIRSGNYDKDIIFTRRVDKYRRVLLLQIARLYYCETVRSEVDRNDQIVYLVGSKADRETVKYIFDYAMERISTFTRNYLKEKNISNNDRRTVSYDYYRGCILGLSRKIKDMIDEREDKHIKTSSGTDLVLVKNGALNQYLKKEFPFLGTGRGNSVPIGTHGSKGYADGKTINIHSGIRNKDSIKQIERR
jgi:hypothetical protein